MRRCVFCSRRATDRLFRIDEQEFIGGICDAHIQVFDNNLYVPFRSVDYSECFFDGCNEPANYATGETEHPPTRVGIRQTSAALMCDEHFEALKSESADRSR